jgi:hypothetical protein
MNRYFYVSSETECISKPNDGYEFSSWVETFDDNSSVEIGVMTIAYTQNYCYFLSTCSIMRDSLCSSQKYLSHSVLRGCHAYISTIAIFTLWRCLRHFCSYRCLILLINVSRYSLPGQIQVVPTPNSNF